MQGLFSIVRACVRFFRKKDQKKAKREKYLKIWAKMYKIWECFEKGRPHALMHATIACMKLLEYTLSVKFTETNLFLIKKI